jgi:hypothetical protein
MQPKWDFAGSTDMWSTSAGGHLMKVVNLTGFTVLRNQKQSLVSNSLDVLNDVKNTLQLLESWRWFRRINPLNKNQALHDCTNDTGESQSVADRDLS